MKLSMINNNIFFFSKKWLIKEIIVHLSTNIMHAKPRGQHNLFTPLFAWPNLSCSLDYFTCTTVVSTMMGAKQVKVKKAINIWIFSGHFNSKSFNSLKSICLSELWRAYICQHPPVIVFSSHMDASIHICDKNIFMFIAQIRHYCIFKESVTVWFMG